MKILGLTGGSGTGKSTVARLLAAHGARWVDADALYHRLCVSCAPMLGQLRAAFGEVLLPDGSLDRPALAAIVFSDPEKLAQLNAIIYPYIRDAALAAFDALDKEGCTLALFDAPTLIENGLDKLCRAPVTGAGVLGVLAPIETRLCRILSRDGLDEAAARRRILAQPPDDFYIRHCDYILYNDRDLAALQSLVDRFWSTLREIPWTPARRGMVFREDHE